MLEDLLLMNFGPEQVKSIIMSIPKVNLLRIATKISLSRNERKLLETRNPNFKNAGDKVISSASELLYDELLKRTSRHKRKIIDEINRSTIAEYGYINSNPFHRVLKTIKDEKDYDKRIKYLWATTRCENVFPNLILFYVSNKSCVTLHEGIGHILNKHYELSEDLKSLEDKIKDNQKRIEEIGESLDEIYNFEDAYFCEMNSQGNEIINESNYSNESMINLTKEFLVNYHETDKVVTIENNVLKSIIDEHSRISEKIEVAELYSKQLEHKIREYEETKEEPIKVPHDNHIQQTTPIHISTIEHPISQRPIITRRKIKKIIARDTNVRQQNPITELESNETLQPYLGKNIVFVGGHPKHSTVKKTLDEAERLGISYKHAEMHSGRKVSVPKGDIYVIFGDIITPHTIKPIIERQTQIHKSQILTYVPSLNENSLERFLLKHSASLK